MAHRAVVFAIAQLSCFVWKQRALLCALNRLADAIMILVSQPKLH